MRFSPAKPAALQGKTLLVIPAEMAYVKRRRRLAISGKGSRAGPICLFRTPAMPEKANGEDPVFGTRSKYMRALSVCPTPAWSMAGGSRFHYRGLLTGEGTSGPHRRSDVVFERDNSVSAAPRYGPPNGPLCRWQSKEWAVGPPATTPKNLRFFGDPESVCSEGRRRRNDVVFERDNSVSAAPRRGPGGAKKGALGRGRPVKRQKRSQGMVAPLISENTTLRSPMSSL